MRRGPKVALTVVVVLFFGVVLAAALAVRALRKPPVIKDGSVLEVHIEGDIAEGPAGNPLRGLLGGVRNNVYDIRRAIDAAAIDSRIRAIALVMGLNNLGWGSAEELRDVLQRVRKAGKPIYALISTDFVDDKNYYIALPASRLTVNPDSGLMINGLYGEAAFFRKALDKLSIKPEYIQFKEYKSAAEAFTRKDMSPEFRESLEYVLRDIEGRFVQAVSEAKKKTVEQVRAVMETGLMTAPEAKQQGFVDELGYWTDLEKMLAKSAPAGAAAERKNGAEKAPMVSIRDYLQAVEASGDGKSGVGVVFASGDIIAGDSDPWNEVIGGDTVAGYLRELRRDSSIKAIILRVNSPGGSAVGSDVIWREVKEARADGKPVVVSMGDLAASGGYYISMGADSIVAQPSTITGSIGVVFGKLNMRGFFEWLGVTFDAVKTTKGADILSFIDSMTPAQEQRIRAWMEQVYKEFVSKAAEGRKKPFELIEPVAHGRIWSGRQAKDRALVDTLGGFAEAVTQVRRLARIPADEKIRFVVYPKRKGLLERIFSGDSPFLQTPPAPFSFLDSPFFKSLQ